MSGVGDFSPTWGGTFVDQDPLGGMNGPNWPLGDHLPPRWSSREPCIAMDGRPTEVAEVKRLMIVADNSFAAQSIRLALRQTSGFQVIGFLDGSAPISARAQELTPDIVL